MNANEQFIVKHYSEDERPILKGHGFDGLTIGDDRQEAQEFVDWLNTMLLQQQALIDGADVAIKELQNRLVEKITEIEALKATIQAFRAGRGSKSSLYAAQFDAEYRQGLENSQYYAHPVKDREKDRLRFSDEAFNRWLDESVSDSGHTVYDLVENVCEAWCGWENSQYYTHPVKEQDGCGNCHACLVGVTEHGLPVTFQRMILCPDCGNKRCPKASNHRHQCTESNEPNQRGSIYTHPVKEFFEDEPQAEELHEILQSNAELTDEEILYFYKPCFYHAEDFVSEIRAILRKAQEK